jgi:tRNA (mo5U34)-methyltransferase
MIRQLERVVRRVFHTFGLDIGRGEGVHAAPLPTPSDKIIRQTTACYSDTFLLSPHAGLSQEEIKAKITRFQWFFPFTFSDSTGDIPVPLDTEQPADQYARAFANRSLHIFSALLSLTGGSLAGKRVLDAGCNAGFFSLQAHRAGAASVLGIDASEKNIEQAHLVRRLVGLEGLDFQHLNTYDLSREQVGEFDIALFLGILYHLDNPVEALARLSEVTREIAVIDTQLVPFQMPMFRVEPDNTTYHHESHANTLAFVPSESTVVLLLQQAGFRQVFRVPPTKISHSSYHEGTWGTFIALKEPAGLPQKS